MIVYLAFCLGLSCLSPIGVALLNRYDRDERLPRMKARRKR